MNRKALASMGWIIRTMRTEAGKRDPPVNKIDKITRSSPFRALVFTILSARTKDANTIAAAGKLLAEAPDPQSLARMNVKKIEKLVRSSGFYRMKARDLSAMAKMLLKDFKGKVPSDLENLVRLPGVGRKTANILLVYSFGKDAIPVDTHVHRISNRLGIVKTKTPEKTEEALMAAVPRKFWKPLNHAFVSYGQTICLPRGPRCGECKLNGICWKVGVPRPIYS
jgi:endonuclease-3